MDDKLTLETEFVLGRALSLQTGVHWDPTKALKWFAFPLKFDISLLLIKIGGINVMGFSFHYKEFLK